MAPPPDATDAGQTRERDTFVLQLPKRIAAVEEIWSRLERGDWNAAQLEALYERIQEISDSSKTFSLFQLNESALSLEVYLSSFIGADIKPGDSQVEAITGLRQPRSGTITLDSLASPALDLDVRLASFNAVNRRDISGAVSGDLQLQGRYGRPRVQGSLQVDRGDLYLDEFARNVGVVDQEQRHGPRWSVERVPRRATPRT